MMVAAPLWASSFLQDLSCTARDFVVFGFIAAMQNLNEAAMGQPWREKEDRGARLLRRYTDKNERYTHVCELVVLIVHMLLRCFWRYRSGARIFCRKMWEASCG